MEMNTAGSFKSFRTQSSQLFKSCCELFASGEVPVRSPDLSLCTIKWTSASEKCGKSYFQNRNPLLPAERLVTSGRTDSFPIYNSVSGNLVSVLWEVKFSLFDKR